MITNSVIANIFSAIGKCSDFLNGKGVHADTARSVLRLTARDDYDEVNDIVLIGDIATFLNDTQDDIGAVTEAIDTVTGCCFIRNAYVIPNADGVILHSNAAYELGAVAIEVKANHIYKVIPEGDYGILKELSD